MEATLTLFEHLFSPLRIGPIEIKNRIFSSGHDTVMVAAGRITDQLVAYHAARAAGGVGLIIIQVAGVHGSAQYTNHVLMADHDDCIPGYQRVAEVASAHGTKVFGQLFHPGREVMESLDGSAPVALAPSAIPNERFHVMPMALGTAMIAELIAGYASAAGRLKRGGLDGVEVVASHGYLPSQFLNPHVNRRSDHYGGSFENRLRFLREVLAAIREEVGGSMAVGLRISADEMDPAGLTQEESTRAAIALDEEGLVDFFNVTLGTSASLAGSDHIAPPMDYQVGYTAPFAAKFKAQVSVPVLVAGRINQPQDAERILAAGLADACAMTRSLICDPEMPAKAIRGDLEGIRACIACNQACIGHFHGGYAISCIQHPETGRELAYATLSRSASPKRVMVIGGGPGGLKAAAIAAARGHEVTLYEQRSRLGGQILLAERLPDRAEFGGASQNLITEALRAGVRVVTNHRIELDEVLAIAPEAVIVATGSIPRRPDLEILGNPNIVDATEIVAGAHTIASGGRVVIADWRGDWVGAGVARIIRAAGREVILAVNGYGAGQAMQQYVRDSTLKALALEQIAVVPLLRLVGADDDSVYFQHLLTQEAVIFEGVAQLVLAQGNRAQDALLGDLEASGLNVFGVGDCLSPRTVEEAVLEGLKVGAQI